MHVCMHHCMHLYFLSASYCGVVATRRGVARQRKPTTYCCVLFSFRSTYSCVILCQHLQCLPLVSHNKVTSIFPLVSRNIHSKRGCSMYLMSTSSMSYSWRRPPFSSFSWQVRRLCRLRGRHSTQTERCHFF